MPRMKIDQKEKRLLDQEMSFWGVKEIDSFPGNIGNELQVMLSIDPKKNWPYLKDKVAERWRALAPLTL